MLKTKFVKAAKNLVRDTPLENASRYVWNLAFRRSGRASYDIATDRIISELPRNATCLDLGANRGQMLRKMMESCPSGSFHAFEPVPEFGAYLKSSFASDPRVRVHEVAVADKEGETVFFVFEGREAWSGMRKRLVDGAECPTEKITVKTVRLDDLLPTEMVDFIKIDIEGAEMLALRGAAKLIARSKPVVVFEHGKGGADYYDTEPEDVYEFFDERGMKVALPETYLSTRNPMTLPEFVADFRNHKHWNFVAWA